MKQESLYPTYYKLAKWISGYSDASTALVASHWNIPKEQWFHDWSSIKCGIALVVNWKTARLSMGTLALCD